MPIWLESALRFILLRRTRYVLCWLAAIGFTLGHYYFSLHVYDVPHHGKPEEERRDANYGHTHVDFGGQWLMGRMIVTGHGRDLYLKSVNKELLDAAFPREDGPPNAAASDADNLLGWMMDAKPQVEPQVNGPLYPPIHALMFAPFGLRSPRQAYCDAQLFFIFMGWVAGLASAGITRWRIWWPIATMFIMVFPGFAPSVHLGQNGVLSLAILLVGWWLVVAGRELAGGIVWGFLAYKPVWALAFLLVPLLTRRRGMLFAMMATGIALILVTLPIVGIDSWFRWLKVGESAANLYRTDENWIFLSRDLLGIARRWMLDFKIPHEERVRPVTAWIGFGLIGAVLAITIIVALLRKRSVRLPDGYGAAFVALGAWVTCYHFIYYDVLMAALPIMMLLANPKRFVKPTLVVTTPSPPELQSYFGPHLFHLPPGETDIVAAPRNVVVLNSLVLTVVALLIFIEQTATSLDLRGTFLVGINPVEPGAQGFKVQWGQMGTPWDTFVLLGLWAYCGVRVLLQGNAPSDSE